MEDLGQNSYAMSTMEVIHTYPSQQISLLYAPKVVDPNASTIVIFETREVHALFPYHAEFIVHVECLNKTIKCTVIDEGVVTSMMSLYCWKGLVFPTF